METFHNLAHVGRHALAALLLAAAGLAPAIAADASGNTTERELLAAVMRQLELVDRLTEHAASTVPQERARYHLDYARLREDVQRVCAGVQDYLVPQRAQPRDPVPLTGDYVRRDERQDSSP